MENPKTKVTFECFTTALVVGISIAVSAATFVAIAAANNAQLLARQERERFEREAEEARDAGRKAGEEAREEQVKTGGF